MGLGDSDGSSVSAILECTYSLRYPYRSFLPCLAVPSICRLLSISAIFNYRCFGVAILGAAPTAHLLHYLSAQEDIHHALLAKPILN